MLKAARLRKCTLGFDWCRSGAHHISEFLRLPLAEFLAIHVYRPNIPLCQKEDPESLTLNTAEPVILKPVYGFSYLFNPHRDIRKDSTLKYHERSFRRLELAIRDGEVHKIFIIADYENKESATFLESPLIIAKYIEKEIESSGVRRYSLAIIRFYLDEAQCRNNLMLIEQERLSDTSVLHRVKINSLLDEPYLRSKMYRLAAKQIFPIALRHGNLWSPPERLD